jgi:hypothetical protein
LEFWARLSNVGETFITYPQANANFQARKIAASSESFQPCTQNIRIQPYVDLTKK